jgi:hypothetical protein
MKNLNIIIFLLLCNLSSSQTFQSARQSYYDKQLKSEVFVEENRKLVIENDSFYVELPNYPDLKGTLKLSSEKQKESGFVTKVYKINNGDLIWVNETIFTLYLDNYKKPTVEETKAINAKVAKNVKDIKFKTQVEFFGEFTAQCIRDNQIKPGMKEAGIILLKGRPNKINKTETMRTVSKQYVYDDMYIYTENGIVTTIQTEE